MQPCQQQPYSVDPSVYPLLPSGATNCQQHITIDLSSVVAAVTRSSDERQRALLELTRHNTELLSTQMAQVRHDTYAMQCQLNAMQQQYQQRQQQYHHSDDALLVMRSDERW